MIADGRTVWHQLARSGWHSFRSQDIEDILSQAEGCIRPLGLRERRIARMGKRKLQVRFTTRTVTCERKGIRHIVHTLNNRRDLRLAQRHRCLNNAYERTI